MAGTARKSGRFTEPEGDWIEHRGDTYRYQVFLTAEAGRFASAAATVPGVAAAGGSEDEALANVRAALADRLRAAKAAGEPMPRTEEAPPAGAVSRWVIVRLGLGQ